MTFSLLGHWLWPLLWQLQRTTTQGRRTERRGETAHKMAVFGKTEHTLIREWSFEIKKEDKVAEVRDVLNPLNQIIWRPGKKHVVSRLMWWQFG